jgi:microsomal dipeptidase-like Zn-dependent dipeptidase
MRHRALALLLLFTLALSGEPARAVDGYVDLHSHLMAEHSFGGGWFWGRLEGPINPAVVRCDGSFPFKTHATTRWPVFVDELLNPKFCGSGVGDTGWHLGKRRGYDPRRCRKFLGIPIPGTCPKPHFEGWPTWTTIAHQQMWQDWLRQAHQGGLQIMVVSLADSEFLCINTPSNYRRYPCDEMSSVVRQLQRAREFVARNGSWVGIATTAAEARSLIAQGKLALVFSVEITKLFPTGDFLAQLDDWRSLGVRSVQVVHHADNRFAGAAQIPALKTAADYIEFLLGDVTGINDIVCRNGAGVAGGCDGINYLNERGLSTEGTTLVRAMMDRGMLLDVSHLSRKSFRDVYNLALPKGYPLIYSHTHTWDTIADCDSHAKRNEKFLLDEEIHMISDTGGMIGLRTGPEYTHQYTPAGYPAGSPVSNRCQGSSRSFAQSLMYAVDRGLNVGFGADLNGFTRQMQPRNRDDCPVDRLQIALNGGPNWLQGRGFGHVGLFPELMADLAAVQVPRSYLDHLNQSAETFLRIWERSESLAVVQGVNLARQATATASSTYCAGSAPGPHCYSPGRVNDGSRSTLLGGFDSWANDANQPMPQWVELTWSSPVNASRVDLYTTSGFEVSAYDIEYWTGSGWTPWLSVTGNVSAFRSHPGLSAISTTRIRVLGRLGPWHQPGYVRINEIEVY